MSVLRKKFIHCNLALGHAAVLALRHTVRGDKGLYEPAAVNQQVDLRILTAPATYVYFHPNVVKIVRFGQRFYGGKTILYLSSAGSSLRKVTGTW